MHVTEARRFEPLKFEPKYFYEVPGYGLMLTGPCPIDGTTEAGNICNRVGALVDIYGAVHQILAVQTFTKTSPPALGEPVGILIGAPRNMSVPIGPARCRPPAQIGARAAGRRTQMDELEMAAGVSGAGDQPELPLERLSRSL